MTTTDVTTAVVIHPGTGEIHSLDAPTENLAALLDNVRDLESRLREAKAQINRELLARLDGQAKWTMHAGDFKLTSPSPQPTEDIDAPALHEALSRLVDAGELSVEALDRAVETVVSYKARKAGVTALRKLGGEIAATIEAHTTRSEPTRYVRVSRSGGQA